MANVERELCRRSAHYFIFDGGMLMTKDEHRTEDPVQPFPDKLHLRVILDGLLLTAGLLPPEKAKYAAQGDVDPQALYLIGMLAVEKSRQIMATWLVAAYCLWRVKYRDHQLILWQSKREDDAAMVVYDKDVDNSRISFMEAHLPPALQSGLLQGASRCHLRDKVTKSHLWGIPEGADIVRSNAPSVLVSDEAAFQPEFASAKDAATPAVKGGGQLVAISSAAPGGFAQWVGAEGA